MHSKRFPLGSQAVRLRLAMPRVHCRTRRLERHVPPALAELKMTIPKCCSRDVLELPRLMTVNDVARRLAVSWDVVRGIVGDDLSRPFDRPKLSCQRRRWSSTGSIHLVKLRTERLSELRRELLREADEGPRKRSRKETR